MKRCLLEHSQGRLHRTFFPLLLSNAVKFTPDGGSVALSARLMPGDRSSGRPDRSDGRFVEMSVFDIGIDLTPGEKAL